MSKVLNANDVHDELPVATDEECVARRSALIYVGMVRPAKSSELFVRKGSPVALSTKEASNRKRQELIKRGIIVPSPTPLSHSRVSRPSRVKEEGAYRAKPIKNDAEYERRKEIYFHIMQEMLISRRELNLVFNQWDDEKMGPWLSWYY
jgi:hypothetical protein